MTNLKEKNLVVNTKEQSMYKEYEEKYFSISDTFGGAGPIVFTFMIDFVLSLVTTKLLMAIATISEHELLALGALFILVFIVPASKILDVIWNGIIKARMRNDCIPEAEMADMMKKFTSECGSVDDGEY